MFDQILIIAGVARSGTSWLGEIINSSPDVAYRFQPLFSHAFKNRIGIDSPREAYESFLQEAYVSQDPFLLQTDKRIAGIYPTFAKHPEPSCLALKKARYHYLHIKFLAHFEQLKLLAIVRNPCAVLASWMANPKEFPPGSDPWAEWRLGHCKNQGLAENFFGFYKWRETTNIFLDLQAQYPNRVRLVRYEDLIENPRLVAGSIYDFARLEVGAQTEAFLAECNSSHSESPYAVYKSKSVRDRWRQTLDPRIIRDVHEELKDTRLETFLK